MYDIPEVFERLTVASSCYCDNGSHARQHAVTFGTLYVTQDEYAEILQWLGVDQLPGFLGSFGQRL